MAGLEHGHAAGFLSRYRHAKEVELVGISEPDRDVAARYVRQFGLEPALIHGSLEAMLEKARPQAVAAFTSTAGHPDVVAVCARRKIPVMMEKPLAIGMEQARAIAQAAAEGAIPVLVNYETPGTRPITRPTHWPGQRRPWARSARSWSTPAIADPKRLASSPSSSPGSPIRKRTAPGPSSTLAATVPT